MYWIINIMIIIIKWMNVLYCVQDIIIIMNYNRVKENTIVINEYKWIKEMRNKKD